MPLANLALFTATIFVIINIAGACQEAKNPGPFDREPPDTRVYYISSTQLMYYNKADAKAACQKDGSILAFPSSSASLTVIANLIGGTSARMGSSIWRRFWLGVTYDGIQKRWILEDDTGKNTPATTNFPGNLNCSTGCETNGEVYTSGRQAVWSNTEPAYKVLAEALCFGQAQPPPPPRQSGFFVASANLATITYAAAKTACGASGTLPVITKTSVLNDALTTAAEDVNTNSKDIFLGLIYGSSGWAWDGAVADQFVFTTPGFNLTNSDRSFYGCSVFSASRYLPDNIMCSPATAIQRVLCQKI